MPRQPAGSDNVQSEAGINAEARSEDPNNNVESSLLNPLRQSAIDGTFNDLFDYASFMWDNEPQSGAMAATRWRDLGFPDMDMDSLSQSDDIVS